MQTMNLTEAMADLLHNGGQRVAALSSDEQMALLEAYRVKLVRRQQLVRLASCLLWWLFTLAVATSPWWAAKAGQFAEDAFVRSQVFLVAQLSIAAAFVLFNLLGAPWRVIPQLRRPPVDAA